MAPRSMLVWELIDFIALPLSVITATGIYPHVAQVTFYSEPPNSHLPMLNDSPGLGIYVNVFIPLPPDKRKLAYEPGISCSWDKLLSNFFQQLGSLLSHE